jgi:thiol reductant ABC exporter CydC subunit
MKYPFGRLLWLARPFTQRMALAVLLGFATIGSSIGLMTTSAYLIASAALHPSIADLQVAIVGVRFFGIARGVCRYLERCVSHEVTFRLLARLRVWFYAALEPLAPARLMHYRSGDLLARIVADIETLENVYLRVIAPPVVALLVAVLVTALLGSFDPRLAATLLAFLLLTGAGLPLLVQALSRASGQRLVQVRSALNSTLVDGIQGMADLLAFGRGEDHLAQVRELGRELAQLQAGMARLSGLHGALTGLLMNLATLAVLAVAIPLVSSAQIDGVYLALLTLATISCFEAVIPLPQALQTLETSLEAARRLFAIVDARPAVTDPASSLPVPAQPSLCVKGLCFTYDAGEPPVLDKIDFDLPAGKRLAIVGPSGAGKSTLVHLLLRFWEYDRGHILLDGQELRHYGQEELRRRIGVVSQRTHLFNATVRENLLMSLPAANDSHVGQVGGQREPGLGARNLDEELAEATEARMVQAAQQAQIHDFIRSLPQGYDTRLGEQGVRLSGGQRQRLAIARAILKDAPLLILDEPTAHLDALTEREVMGTLRALTTGRTVLIVTHRLVGLEMADEILVFSAGRIVERGRHRDLIQRGGLYQRMWVLQSQMV